MQDGVLVAIGIVRNILLPAAEAAVISSLSEMP